MKKILFAVKPDLTLSSTTSAFYSPEICCGYSYLSRYYGVWSHKGGIHWLENIATFDNNNVLFLQYRVREK